MTGLATWLMLIGTLDLIRSGRDASRPRFLLAVAGAGALGSLLLGIVLHPSGAGWAAWAVAVVAAAGWVLGSGLAAARFRGAAVPSVPREVSGLLAAGVAYGTFAVGLLALLLAGPATGSAPRLEDMLGASGLGGIPPERTLLVAGVLALQISTANVVVRLLLDLVGVPASDNEKTLRGGRVLGPMERLVLVGLGLGGSLTGAALVVAAKAILRFPELRVPRAGDPGYGGASDVTEYFLVGSFASWLWALGFLGLAALTSV